MCWVNVTLAITLICVLLMSFSPQGSVLLGCSTHSRMRCSLLQLRVLRWPLNERASGFGSKLAENLHWVSGLRIFGLT